MKLVLTRCYPCDLDQLWAAFSNAAYPEHKYRALDATAFELLHDSGMKSSKIRIHFPCQSVFQGRAVNTKTLLAGVRLQIAVNIKKYNECRVGDHAKSSVCDKQAAFIASCQ